MSKARVNKRLKNRLKAFLRGLLCLILIAGLTAIYAFGVEPRLLAVRHDTLSFNSLPQQWSGRKIAFFSDVHVGPGYPPEWLQRAVAAMALEKPDLILFGGDLVDSETPTDTAYSQQVSAILAGISAPLGKFAIIGNHDNRLRAELKLARGMLEQGGFTLLINQAKTVDGLQIGGLDESYFGDPDFAKTFAGTSDSLFRIVLMHQPDYLPAQPETAMDLILSGHSHNGQATLFGRPLVTVYQGSLYPYGLYKLDNRRQLFVSGGLGTVGIHARLFARPEINILTLKRG